MDCAYVIHDKLRTRKGGKRVQIFTNYRNSSWKLALASVTSCGSPRGKIVRPLPPFRGMHPLAPRRRRRVLITRRSPTRMSSRDGTKATTRSIIRPGGAVRRSESSERANRRERERDRPRPARYYSADGFTGHQAVSSQSTLVNKRCPALFPSPRRPCVFSLSFSFSRRSVNLSRRPE